jgi:hypothetical protein
MKSLKANLTARPGQSTQAAPAKSPALTPWYPASVKPARKGVYIASVGRTHHFYRYWTGSSWLYGSYDLEGASPDLPVWPYQSSIYWRGLASDPAKDAA